MIFLGCKPRGHVDLTVCVQIDAVSLEKRAMRGPVNLACQATRLMLHSAQSGSLV